MKFVCLGANIARPFVNLCQLAYLFIKCNKTATWGLPKLLKLTYINLLWFYIMPINVLIPLENMNLSGKTQIAIVYVYRKQT